MTKLELSNIVRSFGERHRSLLKRVLYGAIGVAVLGGILTFWYFSKLSALVDLKANGGFKQSARIYAAVPEDFTPAALALRSDADNTGDEPGLMASVFDGARARKRVVTFEDIPKILVNAVLSGEDRVFFSHYGINPKRI